MSMVNVARSGSESDKTPLTTNVNLRNTHIAAASALLYCVVMGMVSSYSAPATEDMKKPGSRLRDITENQISWIASLPMIAGIFGNLLAGYVTQRFGRKTVLIFSSFSYLMSWLIIAYAKKVYTIYIGRIISGVCAGMHCVTVPSYIIEIAPTEIRGFWGSMFQVAYVLGVFLIMTLGITLRWSWLAIAGAVVTATACCLMVFMPESPSWLVRVSRVEEAQRGLKFLKGKYSDSQKELQDISDSLKSEPEITVSFKAVLNPCFYKPALIAIALTFFQQSCGINPLIAFLVSIMETTGVSINSGIASAFIACVQVVATMAAGLLMDKCGRRRLYMTSGSFVSLSLLCLGIYSFCYRNQNLSHHQYGWIPLLGFTIYTIAYSFGLGPIPFLMAPEISPSHHRSTIVAAASVSVSLFGFVITQLFSDMKNTLDIYGVYWTYSFFSLLSVVFAYFCLPETKGLAIHQIQRQFSYKDESVTD